MDQTPRSQHLHETIEDYLHVLPQIRTGLSDQAAIEQRQQIIREKLGATVEQWSDYRWQLSHRITSVEALAELLPLDPGTLDQLSQVSQRYSLRFSSRGYPEQPYEPCGGIVGGSST